MNARSDREAAVFGAACRLPAEQRAAYLWETCGPDAMLRQRVEELLHANAASGAFLQELAAPTQQPAEAAVTSSPGSAIRMAFAQCEKAGDRVGRYRLIQQIGEGGCGVVYLAQQEEPVRRQVALKVIKLGMDSPTPQHATFRVSRSRGPIASPLDPR